MLYDLLVGSAGENKNLFMALLIVIPFFAVFFALKLGRTILPKDHGKAEAVGGMQSAGKPTGAGVIFISAFALMCALIVPMSAERIIYLCGIYLSMLSGFFDDSAKIPWGRVKKGLLDLVIAIGVSYTYCRFNGSRLTIALADMSFELPVWLYVLLGAALVWGSINVTNCSDGVDGLCGSLSVISLGTAAVLINKLCPDEKLVMMLGIMIMCLMAYLWYNSNPSRLLMGDAGSRAIGVLLAIAMMKSGSPILFLPICAMLIIDGGASLVKISCIKFLHMKGFMKNITTPIHDHLKKNKAWSAPQVVFRLAIIQLVISLALIAIL